MNLPLRSWKRFTFSTAAAFMGLLMAPAAQAQCPAQTACVPGNATNGNASAFAMGIASVTLRSGSTNLINNATSGQADGYVDYGCFTPSIAATLLVGQSYTLVVTNSNPAATENVRAWIDYNNDGVLDATELVLSSNSATTHTATFAPPATAVLGTALRLRVSSDYSNVTVPTACSTPQYSQVEDYSITLSANSNPPVAAFTTNGLVTCSGCVQFTDASQNVPTSWAWDFGDGQTSTQQNPNHCYATAGTYPVTLTTTNAAGSSATPATATVTYSTQVPVAASCSPATASYCCNYGVTRFRLGTIDNTSADGSAGYQDFTCPQRTQLTVGTPYPMAITLGNTSANQDTRVYLDLNNNGTFTADELIYEAIGQASPTANLTLPGTTTLNQPLRLRIVTDAGGNNPQPCTSPVSGQVEDYTVIALPITTPPVADFTSTYVAGSCVNPIQFTDASSGAPISWAWDFGDGQTSTQQNPSHQYAASGTYTVSLTTTNSIGSNTVTRPNYLTVSVPCLVYCASNGAGAAGGPGGPMTSQFWITGVRVANAQPSAFTNATGREATGYGNYTASIITVEPGAVNITVTTNLNFAHRTLVWLDRNQDGILSNSADELVVNGTTANGPTANTYTTTFTPTATAGSTIRMRVQCSLNNNTPNSCGVNINNAEVEDYSFRISPLATHEAHTLPALTVYPNPTQDGRLHLSLADASAAGTYTATVENLLGARLLTTTLRLAPAAEAELNLGPLAKGVYLLRLRDAQGQTALRRVVRE